MFRPNATDSYVGRSASYFASLLSAFDEIYPVVSLRQRLHFDSAAYWAQKVSRRATRVAPIYFGDVLVDGKADAISFRRFNTADSLLRDTVRCFTVNQGAASDLIRLTILNHARTRDLRFSSAPGRTVLSCVGRSTVRYAIGRARPRDASRPAPPGTLFRVLDGLRAPALVLADCEPRRVAGLLLEMLATMEHWWPTLGVDAKWTVRRALRVMCEVLGLDFFMTIWDGAVWT